MIARHDLVLGFTLSFCHWSFSTSLPHLLVLCAFFSCALSTAPPHLPSRWSCLLFVIYSLSFSIHCLSIAFILSVGLFSASVLLSSSSFLMYAFFISQFVSLPQPIIIFLCSHISPLPFLDLSPLPCFSMPASPCFYSTTNTTCVMEGNIASSGPCWTITMQSNPNRDVCRKQHVCNYCLMRPLSQAECPIRLPMRKQCQGLLKKDRQEGKKGAWREVQK